MLVHWEQQLMRLTGSVKVSKSECQQMTYNRSGLAEVQDQSRWQVM